MINDIESNDWNNHINTLENWKALVVPIDQSACRVSEVNIAFHH